MKILIDISGEDLEENLRDFSENLRRLAERLDERYPNDPNPVIQRDCKRWANAIENAETFSDDELISMTFNIEWIMKSRKMRREDSPMSTGIVEKLKRMMGNG